MPATQTAKKTPAETTATDVVKQAEMACGTSGWNRMAPSGRLVEVRAIICCEMLKQAPGRENGMDFWRAVHVAANNIIDPE